MYLFIYMIKKLKDDVSTYIKAYKQAHYKQVQVHVYKQVHFIAELYIVKCSKKRLLIHNIYI